MATILSSEENTFIYGNLGIDETNHWLGGTDEAEEGIWKWVTGEAWIYNNWSPGEEEPNWVPQPDDGQYLATTGQDYLTFWDRRPSYWDDQGVSAEDYTLTYITEWNHKPVTIPEPGSLVQLGSFFIGMLGFIISKFSSVNLQK